MKIEKGVDGRWLVDGEPLVVQTSRDEDGLYAEGSDLPEEVVEDLLNRESATILVQNQHGEPIVMHLDMDGQSIVVADYDPRFQDIAKPERAAAIATLERTAAEWEQTANRYANVMLGERLIVLDKHERAFYQTVVDGKSTLELKLPDADMVGVAFLDQEQADKVLAELARLCPENGPFVARDFQEYAKEHSAKTRELIAQVKDIGAKPPPKASFFVSLHIDNTSNAAFGDMGRSEEVSRIIFEAADKIYEQPPGMLRTGFPLRDINGNRVGSVAISDDRPDGDVAEGNVRLIIETGNAAFAEEPAGEIARILRAAAEKVQDGQEAFPLHDVNGNSVGSYTYQAPASLVRDGVIDMKQALAEGRVFQAEDGYSGIAEDEYRYAITGPDFEPGYGQGEGEIWLVNAKGEIASGYEDRVVVREVMIDALTQERRLALADVIEGRVAFEEHERRITGDDPELS